MRIDFHGVTGNGEIYMDVMRAICDDPREKSMLDLMCHKAPYTPLLGFKTPVYVDIQERDFDFPKEKRSFVKWDVRKIMDCRLVVNNAPFDVAICSDGLEHLTEDEGIMLLKNMNFLSHKQVLFTPLGELDVCNDDHPDNHRSGWFPAMIDFIMKGHFAYIVFPDFHKSINAGAFFFWHCADIEKDFKRVINELKTKSWTK